jgi:hypothetical protein
MRQRSDPELGISAENTFIYIRGYHGDHARQIALGGMSVHHLPGALANDLTGP